ncbi:LVIVD repeat-containing protein [Pseudothermotoga thermarum]|uniref:hypothetical protein n=1 Tax=Pseudothermotoga thermarum TaxID=119394 RepID=UPI0002E47522|nr:hypothetical protein [Pseudothermotoga thermarum]
MKKLAILVALSVLLLNGCFLILDTSTTSTLVIRFVFPHIKAIPSEEPVSGILTLTKLSRKVERYFELDKGEIVVQGVEEGLWNISIKLMDKNGFVIYQGTDQATIKKNQVSEVTIVLSLTPGDLSLEVQTTSNLMNEVEILLECGESSFSNKKVLTNGSATFEFSNLKSAVWNLSLNLLSEGETALTKGPYGLEIQPGRVNRFKVLIDDFGGVTIEAIVEKLPTVSDVEAFNLDEGIKISWKTVTGAACYDVYRKEGDLWLKLNKDPITECEHIDVNVVEGESYTYVVNAKTSTGLHSGFSEPVTIVRDTKRVFVLTKERKIYRLKYDKNGMLDTDGSTSISTDPLSVRKIGSLGNYLFVVLSGQPKIMIEKYDSTTLSKFSEYYSINEDSICNNAFFVDQFVFVQSSSRIYKLNLNSGSYIRKDLTGIKSISAAENIYVLTNNNELLVLSVDDLDQICEPTNLDGPSYIFASLSYVFVCKSRQWIKIYNWNGSALDYVGEVAYSSTDVASIITDGRYAYIAGYDKKLSVLDLENFKWISNLDMSGKIYAMTIFDEKLLVATGDKLIIYDISNGNLTFKQELTFNADCLLVCFD